MTGSSKKKSESLCKRCAKKSGCNYKPEEGTLVLARCLDFVSIESEEDKK